jgi:hypothetical protein
MRGGTVAGSIGDRLRDRRAAMFVGREPELAAVRRLLAADAELRLLHVWGPGGIGKTELLHAAAREAEGQGWQVARIDARDRAWTAATLAAELERATRATPALVLLDHFEAIAHLDVVLRAECVPKLPDSARVIVAGRIRPASAWREDPAWWSLAEAVLIRPMGLDDRRRLLELRGVDETHARRAAVAIPGHPLTLALFSHALASGGGTDVRFDKDPVVVDALVGRLLAILSPSARELIEAAALAYPVNERVLRHMLERDVSQGDVAELSHAGLLERDGEAFEIHDLVRTAVRADLSVRDVRRRARLLHRLAAHTLDRDPAVGLPDSAEWARAVAHLMSQAQYVPLDLRGELYIAPMWPEAWPEVAAMVERQEGPESLAALRFWRDAGTEMLIVTSDEGAVLGFMSILALDHVSLQQAERDPGVPPLWRRWHDTGVLSSGRAYYVRHWMAAEGHQVASPVQATVFMRITEMLARRDIAGMAQAFREAEWIRAFVTDFSPQLVPGTGFCCDGVDHICLVDTYRERTARESLRQQLAYIDGHWAALAAGTAAEASALAAGISREDFEAWVKEALRACDRLDVLASCALRSSPWAIRRISAGSATAAAARLRDLLRAESRRLFASPRDDILDRVLERTYFHPGAKQRAIADELGLSFGTYRRHLADATRRLVEALWEQARRAGG